MSNPWLVMIFIGLLTFATRVSFIVILDRWKTPTIIRRALRFVPVSVLTAIFVPEVLMPTGTIDVSMSNARLIAGLIAMLVAWKTKNIVWTIVVGMGVLLLTQWYL
ncbi:MAG: AzlD domain-containing protein [Anaerolineales bacterium]|nr:AzlD domain-containing protein [Chloroflexota bacterium]MBL6979705.1 AzlD domain-containing protein [Anaerolineales bacterium]